jgi:hypothetical protein
VIVAGRQPNQQSGRRAIDRQGAGTYPPERAQGGLAAGPPPGLLPLAAYAGVGGAGFGCAAFHAAGVHASSSARVNAPRANRGSTSAR